MRPTMEIPECGVEPGLRFACVLDGRGGALHRTWDEVKRWEPEDGMLWIHLERDDPNTRTWLLDGSGVDPLIAEALLAEESRPRVEEIDDSMLIILRGITRIQEGQESEMGGDVDFVPVHLLIDGRRVISLRDKDHHIHALRDIRAANARGKGPTHSGDLLARISDKIVKDLEPVLEALDSAVDQLEDQVLESADAGMRRRLSSVRRQAIHLSRYLAPQRDALNRLQNEDAPWITHRDKILLREVTDKTQRYIEHLEALRDRTTILQEDLSAMVQERIAHTSNRLTALAGLMLPPSMVAGFFGMNVGGIPGASDPYAFLEVLGAVALMSLGVMGILRGLKWM